MIENIVSEKNLNNFYFFSEDATNVSMVKHVSL